MFTSFFRVDGLSFKNRAARSFARGSLDEDKVAVAAGNRERLNTAVAGFSSVIVPP